MKMNKLLLVMVSVLMAVQLFFVLYVTLIGKPLDQTQLCYLQKHSWDTRVALIETLTEPSHLSPQAEKLFPASQTQALRLQIEQANAIKATHRAKLLVDNGRRPSC